MCYHNFSQHNGCGHIGESYTQPWTLCQTALARLSALRGPNSPPLTTADFSFAPPKRSSSARRFFSLSGTLSRSSTSPWTTSSRAVSSPSGNITPRASTSTSSHGSSTPPAELDYSKLLDHQLIAVRCVNPTKRTHVSREMNVCKVCTKWLDDMRSMLTRYDKTGSIRGTTAFEKFLKWEGEGAEGDLTLPAEDGADFGARQAIIMGVSESAMNQEGPKGLGTMGVTDDGEAKYLREKF